MPRTLTELAQHLNRRQRRDPHLPRLVLMTDPRQPDPLAAARRLPPGSWVILRHYDAPERLELGRRLQRACKARRLRLLVAADIRLAVALRADGLHLPEHLVGNRHRVAAIVRRGGLVTAAAHSHQAVARARAARVDAVLLSPVFATASHPGAGSLGPLRFAAWAHKAGVPVYALGGIRAATLPRVRNAAGVATVGGI